MFPTVIAKIIGEYSALWTIVSWVTELGFTTEEISIYLSKNPMAMDVINLKNINWDNLCENPADWAVDILLANKDKIDDFYYLAYNTNQRAFQWIIEERNVDEMHTEIQEVISGNPIAIDYLKSHKDIIRELFLMWNPNAKDLIEDMKISINYHCLSSNHSDWAVDLLFKPGIIESISGSQALSSNSNPRIVQYLILHPELIDWNEFSENPTAIEHLHTSSKKVTVSIYANPNIFEPTIPIGLVETLVRL
jgi:hypothetical protein